MVDMRFKGSPELGGDQGSETVSAALLEETNAEDKCSPAIYGVPYDEISVC